MEVPVQASVLAAEAQDQELAVAEEVRAAPAAPEGAAQVEVLAGQVAGAVGRVVVQAVPVEHLTPATFGRRGRVAAVEVAPDRDRVVEASGEPAAEVVQVAAAVSAVPAGDPAAQARAEASAVVVAPAVEQVDREAVAEQAQGAADSVPEVREVLAAEVALVPAALAVRAEGEVRHSVRSAQEKTPQENGLPRPRCSGAARSPAG